jgi:hypothetical protein
MTNITADYNARLALVDDPNLTCDGLGVRHGWRKRPPPKDYLVYEGHISRRPK